VKEIRNRSGRQERLKAIVNQAILGVR